jgi:hypothetical protein
VRLLVSSDDALALKGRGEVMPIKDVPSIIGSTLSDVLAGLDFVASNLGGTLLGTTLGLLLRKRLEESRDIFLEEVRDARRPIRDVHDQDEFVSMLYRYLDASRQGAARLNLRLLAKVVKGQHEREGLYASDFLRYADLISSLSREEAIFLATLHRLFKKRPGSDNVETYRLVVEELTKTAFKGGEEVKACATALQRTGLLLPIMTPVIGGAGYSCLPSPLLDRIAELASFEDALRQEPQTT